MNDETELATPDSAYEKVWKPLVEDENGKMDTDVLKSLLFDYGAMLHANSILFPYITGNRITHPQNDIEEVIEVADQELQTTLEDGIRAVLSHLLDYAEANPDSPEKVIDLISSLFEKPDES